MFSCELVDETGSMRSGKYLIDVRLSSELVEDNVGPQAKHVIPFGPDEHRSGIRVWHDVWSRALSPVSPGRRQVVRSGDGARSWLISRQVPTRKSGE